MKITIEQDHSLISLTVDHSSWPIKETPEHNTTLILTTEEWKQLREAMNTPLESEMKVLNELTEIGEGMGDYAKKD